MCTPAVQLLFRRVYAGLSIALCALGIFLVATRPPLHTEVFMVTPKPVNGSLQVVMCQKNIKVQLADGTVTQHCEYQVDHIHRIHVDAYHVSMGLPILLVCGVGCVFALMTSKESAMHSGLMTADMLFVVGTYSPDLSSSSHHGRRNTLYRWECVFWLYVFVLHLIVVLMLASPVDVFDCIVIVVLQQLCFMYLCRPRQCDSTDGDEGGGYGLYSLASGSGSTYEQGSLSSSSWGQGVLVCLLLVLAFNNFASIPHAYEEDRVWAFGVLLAMDLLLLVVHMYDHVPTMYTIIMGRMLYVIVLNVSVLSMFYMYRHRLQLYESLNSKMV
jgi:hypothetical protein